MFPLLVNYSPFSIIDFCLWTSLYRQGISPDSTQEPQQGCPESSGGNQGPHPALISGDLKGLFALDLCLQRQLAASQCFSIPVMAQVKHFWHFLPNVPFQYLPECTVMVLPRMGYNPGCGVQDMISLFIFTHYACCSLTVRSEVTLINLEPQMNWGKIYSTTVGDAISHIISAASSSSLMLFLCSSMSAFHGIKSLVHVIFWNKILLNNICKENSTKKHLIDTRPYFLLHYQS